ncbi:hypothetical protein ISR94_00505 [Candidatus Microgenomates bacterium]|nr:hypothetical protein [Candidatus Microgenomates bacterium]
MKKEVFLAIFAGVAAGLVLAFGVWRLTANLKSGGSTNTDVQTSSSPTPDASFSVTIAKPSNLSVSVDEKITIEGLTKQGSTIIISTESKDFQEQTGRDGSFQKEITLAGGLNIINITAFNANGQSATTKLNIVYSSEFEKYLNDDETSTSSASTVREKVQQKLDSTLNQPTSYFGTVTDIADSTIQIRSDDNGIQQIMVTELTSYVSDVDLAIGDFIVAMGFKNGNEVLDTKRILITKPIEDNVNQAVWSTISEIEKKNVSFTNQQGETISLDFPKTWVGPNIADLEVGMELIIVGTIQEKILSLRTIFVLSNFTIEKNLTE